MKMSVVQAEGRVGAQALKWEWLCMFMTHVGGEWGGQGAGRQEAKSPGDGNEQEWQTLEHDGISTIQ